MPPRPLVAHPLPTLLRSPRRVQRQPVCGPPQASSSDQGVPVLLHLQQVQEPLSSAELLSPRAIVPSPVTGTILLRSTLRAPRLLHRMGFLLLPHHGTAIHNPPLLGHKAQTEFPSASQAHPWTCPLLTVPIYTRHILLLPSIFRLTPQRLHYPPLRPPFHLSPLSLPSRQPTINHRS